MRIFLSLFCFLIWTLSGISQTAEIKVLAGKISDFETGEVLPYASIINLNTNKGTISNDKGYFELDIQSLKDSIQISYIGYQTLRFSPNSSRQILEIRLRPQSQLLSAVEIKAKDYGYLLDLLEECKEQARLAVDPAKSYFQLKSYSNQKQIELVENFYRAETQGYHLNSLELKVGRLGLRKQNQNIYASLESSKAIVDHNIFQASPYFPNQPMYLKKRQILKRYYVDLARQYIDDEKDTIVVLSLESKEAPERHFKSKIWINKNKKQILKVNFKGRDLDKFPFIPLFPKDSLSQPYLEVNKEYIAINGQMFLDHIDFIYGFKYHSPRHEPQQIKTQALLKFYEHFSSFEMPLYDFRNKNLGEYRLICAFPENEFFWKNHNELQLKDEIDSNSLFLRNPKTLNADDLFNPKKMGKSKFLESRFINWSEKRIILRPLPEKEAKKTSQDFDIHTSLFVDRNQYQDSLNILIANLLDPYGSYFNKELDSINVAFVNIFFDLVEVERRILEKKILQSNKSFKSISDLFEESEEKLANLKRDYFYETQGGANLKDLERYNHRVINELGIDNFDLMRIPKPSEERAKKRKKLEQQ